MTDIRINDIFLFLWMADDPVLIISLILFACRHFYKTMLRWLLWYYVNNNRGLSWLFGGVLCCLEKDLFVEFRGLFWLFGRAVLLVFKGICCKSLLLWCCSENIFEAVMALFWLLFQHCFGAALGTVLALLWYFVWASCVYRRGLLSTHYSTN